MEDRIEKIVDTLFRGTQASKLNWEPTDRENEYTVRLKNGGVAVESYEAFDDDTGEHRTVADISFLDKKGQVIERLAFDRQNEPIDYFKLAHLHNAARRSHLKIDEKLDEILGEIESAVGDVEKPF